MRDRKLRDFCPGRREYDYIRLHQDCNPDSPSHLWSMNDVYDWDHHCLGYTKLLRVGVNGLLAEIAQRQEQPCTPHQAANLEAMARSSRAMIRVAERFGEKAKEMLAGEGDSHARACLTRIAESAGKRQSTEVGRKPMPKLTHEVFDRRVKKAMEPPVTGPGQGFSPGVNRMRQEARPRVPLRTQRKSATQ